MCQGASACLDQRVVEVDGRKLRRRKKDQMHVSLSEMGARITARAFLAAMLNSLPLLFMIG